MSYNDVFISYGRKESKNFARKLHDRLVSDGLKVWFDQEDIPLGVDFQDQIDDGITNAHNFIFIIAPHAIDSAYCAKEIELAHSYNKRMIPLLHVPPTSAEQEEKIHPAIRRINWTPFQEEDKFEENYHGLLNVLKTHEGYVYKHTLLLDKALRWKKSNFESTLLLVGDERNEAEDWLKHDFANELPPCHPIDLQCTFIAESKKNAFNLHTDVFLSQSAKDKDKSEQVRLMLQRRGWTVWWAHYDLKAGMKEYTQIRMGIEQADNYVLLLSPEALENDDRIAEVEYAANLNKRIVLIVTEEIEKKKLPNSLQGETLIKWQNDNNLDEFLAEISNDKDYLTQHTNILTAALKWERQNYNQSILFRGFNLQEAENWLRIAEKRRRQQPTDLQLDFLKESSQKGDSLPSEVFISYSRADADFARHLNSELQIHGKTTWFDQASIAPTSDFQEEIFKGIKSSDNFVFVITERSLTSSHCEAEIQYAQKLNKRFITLLLEEVESQLVPPSIADIQWIDFRKGQREFHIAFSELLRSLDTDREHVAAHTRWAQATEKWEEGARVEELLLRGIECEMAQAWLTAAIEENKSPQPTPAQNEFILASKAAVEAYHRRKKLAAIRLRIMAIVMAFLAIAAFFLAGWSFMLREQAEVARQSADARRIEAEQAKKDADYQREVAEEERIVAEKATKKAQKNFERAEKEKLRAERNEAIAKSKTEEAEANLQKANENETRANKNATRAKMQEEKAIRNAELAQESLKESRAIAFIAKAREVERENPTLAMQLAFAAQKILPKDQKIQNTIRNIYYKNNFYYPFASLESAVISVSYSPDGNSIAVVTKNNQVQIWNTLGEKTRTLWGHQAPITSLSFSPDSKHCVTGSLDKTVRLWDLKTGFGKIVGVHKGVVNDVSVCPTKNIIASASDDKTIGLWTFNGFKLPFSGKHKGAVTAVKFSPNGKYILSGSEDKMAILWKRSGGKKEKLRGHHGAVTAVAFSPDGKYMATGSDDRDIIVWNLDGEVHSLLSGHELSINDITFSFDSKYLISASKDKTARLWTIIGEELQLFKGHAEEVTSVAFSPDENFVLSASSDHTLKIWLVNTEAQQVLRTITPALSAFAISKHGHIAVAAGDDKIYQLDENAASIRVLDNHKGKVQKIAFAPNATYMVSGDNEGVMKIWDLDGNEMKSIQVGAAEITLLKVAPKGDKILVGASNGNLNLWTTDGWVDIRFAGLVSMAIDADFNHDGSLLLTVTKDGSVDIWDMEAKRLLNLPPKEGVASAGTFKEVGSNFLVGYESGLIRLWDQNGNIIKVFGGHGHRIGTLKTFDDNNTFVSASDDKSARLWDLQGNELQIYTGHKDLITHVALSSSSGNKSSDNSLKTRSKRSLITASRDNTIRRWNRSVSFEEYSKMFGFGKLPIADQLTYGLLEFDSLKKSKVISDLIDGGNYYLSKAISHDKEKNLKFKRNSVILISNAVALDNTNEALKQRLASAYHELAWDYLERKDYLRAKVTAGLGYDLFPEQLYLAVRNATALLYLGKWNEAKALYKKWIVKDSEAKSKFLHEINRLESLGLYARYRRQAKELLEE